MKKEDISVLMASVTLLVLFKTLILGNTEDDLEQDAPLNAEGVSDIENEFFQADVYDENEEEEETAEEIEQDQAFMEWLQTVVHKMNDGIEVLANSIEEQKEEEAIAEAASDSDRFTM